MKVEEEVKKEELNPIEGSLSDLSVTQADETKGGTLVTDYALLECRFRDSTGKL